MELKKTNLNKGKKKSMSEPCKSGLNLEAQHLKI